MNAKQARELTENKQEGLVTHLLLKHLTMIAQASTDGLTEISHRWEDYFFITKEMMKEVRARLIALGFTVGVVGGAWDEKQVSSFTVTISW